MDQIVPCFNDEIGLELERLSVQDSPPTAEDVRTLATAIRQLAWVNRRGTRAEILEHIKRAPAIYRCADTCDT